MKADYVHKDSRTLEEKPQVFTRWIDTTIEELKQQNQKYKDVIDKAIEYLEEPNRDSFDYSKAKLLDILKEVE